MPRVLLGELKQETATFNPAPTRYDDFSVYVGRELIDALRATKTEIAGALDIFAEAGIDVAPTIAASAVSGGRVVQTDLDRLIHELLQAASDLGEVDGLYLCLHGAMAGEREDDPEGLLLEKLRMLFPIQPFVASLDLHAVLTDRMIQAANILVLRGSTIGRAAAWFDFDPARRGPARPATAVGEDVLRNEPLRPPRRGDSRHQRR